MPFFLLLGIGGAGDERPLLPRRAALVSAGVLVAAVLVLFVPPWLSARLTVRGDVSRRPSASTRSRSTRTWSPAARAPTPQAALVAAAGRGAQAAASRRAPLPARRGLRAGRPPAAARRELLAAKRIDPREPRLDEALAKLKG